MAPLGAFGAFHVLRGGFFDASDGMLEFSDKEVQFEGGLRLHGVQVWHDDVRERLAEVVQLVSLAGLVCITMQFNQFAFQDTDLCEGLDDCEGRGGCLGAFQNRRKHVEALFGECLETVFRMFSFASVLYGRKFRP